MFHHEDAVPETLPMSLDALQAEASDLRDFLLTSPGDIQALLRELLDANAKLNLNGSDGTVYSTTLWAIDRARDTLVFSAEANDSRVSRLVECDDVVAVGYLDSIKVQFDVDELVLVHSGRSSALNGALPREVFRIQRRNSYRVKPLVRTAPMARLRHPSVPDMQLALRLLDVSIGGCALLVPDNVPPLQPGSLLANVGIDLDVDTRFHTSLMLQHVTSFNPDAKGVRIGCEWVKPSADVNRSLQRYIDQTQKRRRLMAIE
jgi:c-di-GMP-binding flagellar brake protein YcgR